MSRVSLTNVRPAGVAGAILMTAALAGCAVKSPSMLGASGQRGALTDPSRSAFAPKPTPLPALSQPPPQPISTDASMIVVQDRETISEIAQRHKVSIFAIMHENRLKDPNVFPGMVLRLPRR